MSTEFQILFNMKYQKILQILMWQTSNWELIEQVLPSQALEQGNQH